MSTNDRLRTRRRILRIGGLALAAGLAGCTGDSDGDGGGETPTTGEGTTATTRATTTTATAAATETATTTTAETTETTAATDPTGPSGPFAEAAKLVADDGDEEDQFGRAVAVEGNTAIVGVPHDEDPNGDRAGAAYVFESAGGEWRQVAKLAADDGDPDDRFGGSVAVDGDTALVGAPHDEDPTGSQGGAVYAFERMGDDWRQVAKLAPGDGDKDDRFGWAVAMEGDTALVGANHDDRTEGGAAPFVGSVYVFERAEGDWRREARLRADDGDGADQFGSSIALAGDTAVVGARTDDDPNGSDAGSAYVFERADGDWHQVAKLSADDGDTGDYFGASVAVAGDAAVVGAPRHEASDVRWHGAVYVFERAGGEWRQAAKLIPSTGESEEVRGDRFGASVALAGATALVGASHEDEPNGAGAGAVLRFEWTDGDWRRDAKLLPGDGGANDFFGGSLALSPSATTALVGAPEDQDPHGRQGGSAYVFER